MEVRKPKAFPVRVGGRRGCSTSHASAATAARPAGAFVLTGFLHTDPPGVDAIGAVMWLNTEDAREGGFATVNVGQLGQLR